MPEIEMRLCANCYSVKDELEKIVLWEIEKAIETVKGVIARIEDVSQEVWR